MDVMTIQFAQALHVEAVVVGANASSWQDAVQQCGYLLVKSGVTAADYTQEMITAITDLGPYVVIAPGLALAHSRPSPAVQKTGLSWLSLAEPVEFGHAHNDPVNLVIGLAAFDHDSHLEMMGALARILMDEEELKRIRTLTDAQQVHTQLLALAQSL